MKRLLWLLTVCLLWAGTSTAQSSPVSMTVQAGFDGAFRADEWTPLYIDITNDGAPITGHLIVRPETNGRALASAYSTPIDLPTGTRKEAFLYVRLRDFARQVVVELVGEDGQRYTQQSASIRPIPPRDKVYVVVNHITAANVPLVDVRPSGHNVVQVTWQPSRVPPHSDALYAVDVMVLHDLVDPEAFTIEQSAALKAWVLNGGHLISTGGIRWDAAGAVLGDLLPVEDVSVQIVDDVTALAEWVNSPNTLEGRVELAIGQPLPDAHVLVTSESGPLMVRRSVGDGTVTFLAFDPTLAPLSNWDDFPTLFTQIMASVPLANSWGRGILDTGAAATAIATLPGEELLPPVAALLGFIVAYLAVIGPLNYFILTRIKRQEWAWITIPFSILLFTLIASTVGFNLRGNEVLLSRLRVIRSWDQQPTAIEQSVVGLLSPRRDVFSLTPNDERFVYTLPSIGQAAANLQSSAEIAQSVTTSASNVTVDGGIYSNFSMARTVDAPAISGALTLITNADGSQTFQGFVRNDTPDTLQTPLLLTRRGSLQLPDLIPGQLLTIAPGQFTYMGRDTLPVTSQFENSRALRTSFTIGRQASIINELVTAALVLPQQDFAGDVTTARTFLRRQAFLQSFIRDQYNSIALGDRVYLIGWANDSPRDISISESTWRSVDDTVYVVGLSMTIEPPALPRITLAPDQMMWTVTERIIPASSELARTTGLLDVTNAGMDDVVLNPDEGIAVQFTPLPSAQLSQVDELTIAFTRGSGFANQLDVALWNWNTLQWVIQDMRLQEFTLSAPAPYIGPDNAVRLRVISTFANGVSRLRNLRITMTGRPA